MVYFLVVASLSLMALLSSFVRMAVLEALKLLFVGRLITSLAEMALERSMVVISFANYLFDAIIVARLIRNNIIQEAIRPWASFA
jgi:hypothetical protein